MRKRLWRERYGISCDSNMSKGKQTSREYKAWTPELDATLIRAMLRLVENKQVESEIFQNGGFKKLETLMKTLIPGFPDESGTSHQSFPGAKGLNKKSFPYYDQLARIFGKDGAVGGESESPADADSPHIAAVGKGKQVIVRTRCSPDKILKAIRPEYTTAEKTEKLVELGFDGVTKVKIGRMSDDFNRWAVECYDMFGDTIDERGGCRYLEEVDGFIHDGCSSMHQITFECFAEVLAVDG
ncbi:hypothetical protein LINPERPRIM_LOCUS1147 [Linum perenne]